MPDPPTHLLLVRLHARQPSGEQVGESKRTCHLVPVPADTADIPTTLTAYCGLQIEPGAAELLASISGMPCELCMARSPGPLFATLRKLTPTSATHIPSSDNTMERD
jgi:hypothetical protein